MTVLLWPFQWVALVGLIVSVLVHAMALLRIAVPVPLQPYINDQLYSVLHMGIFVVWIPTVLAASSVSNAYRMTGVSWSTLLKGCPSWMRQGVYGLFAYAVVNFLVSIGLGHSAASGEEGVFLQRSFSGHWLLFYGAAFAVLHSVTRKPELFKAQTCVAGHAVGPDDQFCPTCGQALPKEMR